MHACGEGCTRKPSHRTQATLVARHMHAQSGCAAARSSAHGRKHTQRTPRPRHHRRKCHPRLRVLQARSHRRPRTRSCTRSRGPAGGPATAEGVGAEGLVQMVRMASAMAAGTVLATEVAMAMAMAMATPARGLGLRAAAAKAAGTEVAMAMAMATPARGLGLRAAAAMEREARVMVLVVAKR